MSNWILYSFFGLIASLSALLFSWVRMWVWLGWWSTFGETSMPSTYWSWSHSSAFMASWWPLVFALRFRFHLALVVLNDGWWVMTTESRGLFPLSQALLLSIEVSMSPEWSFSSMQKLYLSSISSKRTWKPWKMFKAQMGWENCQLGSTKLGSAHDQCENDRARNSSEQVHHLVNIRMVYFYHKHN